MSFLSKWILTKVLPSAHRLLFSVSLLTETHFDDLKGRLCFFHYSNIWELDISDRPRHPFMSAVTLPPFGNQSSECPETFMLLFFYFKEYYSLLLYFWCNIVQIHLAELFINWNKVTEHRSAWALSFHLKHLQHAWSYTFVFFSFGKRPWNIVHIKENIRSWVILLH